MSTDSKEIAETLTKFNNSKKIVAELTKEVSLIKENMVKDRVIVEDQPYILETQHNRFTFTFVPEKKTSAMKPFKDIQKLHEEGKISKEMFQLITRPKTTVEHVVVRASKL